MRRKLVAGNWKMHGLRAQLSEVEAIAAATAQHEGVDVALCVPFTLIAPAVALATRLPIGAQDVHEKDQGAHTGCVSAPMLIEAGAAFGPGLIAEDLPDLAPGVLRGLQATA